MKKCPTCGELMGADVNFCTNCGTDITQVPVQTTASQQSRQEVQQTQTQPTQQVQQATPVQDTQQSNSNEPGAFAVYWNWMVESWKHPTNTLGGNRWYGIINVAAVAAILTIGIWKLMSGGLHNTTSGLSNFGQIGQSVQSGINNYADQQISNVAWSLFFALLISSAVMIGCSILAYIFVYRTKVDILDYFTRVAQYSNYNAILAVVIFVISLASGNSYEFISLLILIMFFIFLSAVLIPVLADENGKRDKLFGALITFVGVIFSVIIFIGMSQSVWDAFSRSLGI